MRRTRLQVHKQCQVSTSQGVISPPINIAATHAKLHE